MTDGVRLIVLMPVPAVGVAQHIPTSNAQLMGKHAIRVEVVTTLPACAEPPNVAKVKVRIIVEANVGVEGVNAVHIVRTQYIRLKRHMKAVTSLLTVFHMRIIMNLHGMPLCTLPLRRWT